MEVFGIGLKQLATATALLALPLVASAAPPPPPGAESSLGRMQMKESLLQMRRFEAAGLPVPTPPSNGGQCVIDTSGQFGPATGQRGASGTYRLYEIQRWVVSTTAMPPGQSPLLYSVQWSTSGNGERHEDNGVGTTNDWTFAISGASPTQLKATRIASTGNWLLQALPVSFPNGVVVTQQQTISGTAPRPPGMMTQPAAAFLGFGNMTAAPPPPGSPAGTLARMTYAGTWQVPKDITYGFPQPGYARGTISCTWTLAVGP